MTKQIMDFTRPSVSFDPIDIDIYNSRVRLAGKHTWDDINVNLRDDASGAVTKLVGEQLQRQLDFMEQSSASSGSDYKFTTRLEILDGGNGANEPNVLETWEIYGCYLSNVNYGDMNYSSSEPATVSLTLRYDNAVQTPIGNGVGAEVGRTLGDNVN